MLHIRTVVELSWLGNAVSISIIGACLCICNKYSWSDWRGTPEGVASASNWTPERYRWHSGHFQTNRWGKYGPTVGTSIWTTEEVLAADWAHVNELQGQLLAPQRDVLAAEWTYPKNCTVRCWPCSGLNCQGRGFTPNTAKGTAKACPRFVTAFA